MVHNAFDLYDGLLPIIKSKGETGRNATPDDLYAIKAWIEARRTETTPFDIVIEGTTPGDDPASAHSLLESWAAAGATWWIESIWDRGDQARIKRLRQGPPRFD